MGEVPLNNVNRESRDDNVKDVYSQVCSAYERIDDFRAKLLGFLPVVSGGGLFFLLEQANEAVGKQATTQGASLVTAGGTIGILFTLGLLVYEERGIHYCIRLTYSAACLRID